MAIYAIGDVQGCFHTLLGLLKKIPLRSEHDEIWVAGDLVNRGPHSLEVLRWAHGQRDRLSAVLGNHDLHLLSRWRGVAAPKRKDSFSDVLQAPDRDELLEWLLKRPLVVRRGSWLLVHAGLLPDWNCEKVEELALEAEAALQGSQGDALLQLLADKAPVRWNEKLKGLDRHAAVVRCLCNLRIVDAHGQPRLGFTDAPELTPRGMRPWYDAPDRQSRDAIVVCGHWAAQGLRIREDMIALDSGAVWGGVLSAVRLEDRAVFQVPLLDPISGPGRSQPGG